MFEEVLQYEIPLWHPLVVHLPIATVLVAAVAAAGWAAFGRPFWRRATLLLLGVGLAGAILSYRTGEALEEDVVGVPIVEALIDHHETAARWALYSISAAFLVALGVTLYVEQRAPRPGQRRSYGPVWARVVLLLLTLLAAAAILWTGRIGGTMTWGVLGS